MKILRHYRTWRRCGFRRKDALVLAIKWINL
jgi:hypothetical protein